MFVIFIMVYGYMYFPLFEGKFFSSRVVIDSSF